MRDLISAMLSDRVATAMRSPLQCFALLWFLSTAALWRPVVYTFSQTLHNSEFSHISLVLPTSALLIYVKWNSIKERQATALPQSMFLFAVGIAIAITSGYYPGLSSELRMSAAMLALVICWIAAFVLCFGMRFSQSMLFPLCFLFWLVPIPPIALAAMVWWLQRASAFTAWLLFSAVNVPTSLSGVVLSLPGVHIEVGRECSSIRSSLILLETTMVLAHLLLRTRWRKALIVAIALPLSVGKNALRIFTLGILGSRVDPAYFEGELHRQGGTAFFGLALVSILLLVCMLRRSERQMSSSPIVSARFSAC